MSPFLRHLSALLLSLVAFSAFSAVNADYYGDKPPLNAPLLPGYCADSVHIRLAGAALQPVEGIWSYPDAMMTVAVEKFSSPQFSSKIAYRIVMISSDDMSLLPGTVIGYLAESAKSDKFRMYLYCQQHGTALSLPVKCVATLSAQGSYLTFQKPEIDLRVHVNLSRFLPSFLRGIYVTPSVKSETLPQGFRRVYPHVGAVPGEIRYL
jgi:hypothetical protein